MTSTGDILSSNPLVDRNLCALGLGVNADGTHARRAVSAASKQLVELADGLYVLRIASALSGRRVLEILRRTEIGGDRLLEIPLLTQTAQYGCLFRRRTATESLVRSFCRR